MIRSDRATCAAAVRAALALLACFVMSPSALAGTKPEALATPEQMYQLALEARTEGDYRSMLSLLRRAAEGGELGAQEMLGTVLLVGPALYGPQVAADRCEAAHWLRRSAAQGSEVGRSQLMLLAVPRGRLPAGKPCF